MRVWTAVSLTVVSCSWSSSSSNRISFCAHTRLRPGAWRTRFCAFSEFHHYLSTVTSSANTPIKIGTRTSELALRQARMVQAALAEKGLESTFVTFKTVGDKRLDESLSAIGAKGLFTKELETALLKKKIDVAVHSLKDLPTESPEGLVVAAVLRSTPRSVGKLSTAV